MSGDEQHTEVWDLHLVASGAGGAFDYAWRDRTEATGPRCPVAVT